jgi:hypothetical protein
MYSEKKSLKTLKEVPESHTPQLINTVSQGMLNLSIEDPNRRSSPSHQTFKGRSEESLDPYGDSNKENLKPETLLQKAMQASATKGLDSSAGGEPSYIREFKEANSHYALPMLEDSHEISNNSEFNDVRRLKILPEDATEVI